MTANAENRPVPGGLPWRIIGWGAAASILALPWIANAPWTLSDFIVMGALLGSAGLMLELAVRASDNLAYRAGAAVAVGTAFLLTWVDLAVGFVGLIFFVVLAVAAAGSVLARFRPAGMAKAMAGAAAAQVLTGLFTLGAIFVLEGSAGLFEAAKVATGTIVFSALWLLSGALFRRAG